MDYIEAKQWLVGCDKTETKGRDYSQIQKADCFPTLTQIWAREDYGAIVN